MGAEVGWIGMTLPVAEEMSVRVVQTNVRDRRSLRENAKFWFPELYPAGKILYVRPTSAQMRCCGMYEQDTEWTAEWVRRENLRPLILSWRSMELHFPNIIKVAFKEASRAIGSDFVEMV